MPYSLTRINRNIDAYLNDKPLEKRPGFQSGGRTSAITKGIKYVKSLFPETPKISLTWKRCQGLEAILKISL